MKRRLITAALVGMVGSAVALTGTPVHARNASVENALATYPDLSTFYAALLNTGVANELNENTHYTILAPTNEAFAEIRPNLFPCFYAVQCRAQVANILRDHIIAGPRTLTELTKQAEVPTMGPYRVYAESPFVGDYSLGNQRVLSGADIHGNMIYRLDGVIVSNQQLVQFRNQLPVANAVTEEKTITMYRTSGAYPVPGGTYSGPATTTVTEKAYITPASTTTLVYPNGVSGTNSGQGATVITTEDQ